MTSPQARDRIELLCKRIAVEKDPKTFGQLIKELNDLLELKQPLNHAGVRKLMCSVCDEPVQLETTKTNEDGHAVHEECYLASLLQRVTPKNTPQWPAAYNPYAVLVRSPQIPALLDLMIEATAADFGNVQLLDSSRRGLKIVAHQGFGREFLSYFDTVCSGSFSCGAAMYERRRIAVTDILHDPLFQDAQTQAVMLDANVRACQSTPLFDPSGNFIGVVSTHFRQPTQFDPSIWKRIESLTEDFTNRLFTTIDESAGCASE